MIQRHKSRSRNYYSKKKLKNRQKYKKKKRNYKLLKKLEMNF